MYFVCTRAIEARFFFTKNKKIVIILIKSCLELLRPGLVVCMVVLALGPINIIII